MKNMSILVCIYTACRAEQVHVLLQYNYGAVINFLIIFVSLSPALSTHSRIDGTINFKLFGKT